MKELSHVSVALTSPTTLLSGGSRFRLVHDGDEITFIESRVLRRDRVALRYPVDRLYGVRQQQIPVETPFSLVMAFIQGSRNFDRYGFWDGMAATNLQNLDRVPDVAPAVKLAFFVPDSDFKLHMFMLTERAGGAMPLEDCAAYLQGLILNRGRPE